ncbi:MAG: universal stress protein [Ignavibacteria bacterium]
MALKNMMVHVDGGARTAARLQMAAAIASRLGARLVGVFAQRAEAEQVGVVPHWPPASYVQASGAAEAAFRRATQGLAQAAWIDVNRGGDVELLYAVTAAARYVDLVVLGQYDGNPDGKVPAELPEEVILTSGRPALVVPYVGDYPSAFERPLIAWNNSRESAHALNDALPLIAGCKEAVVLSLDTRTEEAEASCTAVTRQLACHGIKAVTEVLTVEDVGIMDMLLNRVTDQGADLLVMGAHGQIGFPFVSRGAGTRYILRNMTVPVLMSN